MKCERCETTAAVRRWRWVEIQPSEMDGFTLTLCRSCGIAEMRRMENLVHQGVFSPRLTLIPLEFLLKYWPYLQEE